MTRDAPKRWDSDGQPAHSLLAAFFARIGKTPFIDAPSVPTVHRPDRPSYLQPGWSTAGDRANPVDPDAGRQHDRPFLPLLPSLFDATFTLLRPQVVFKSHLVLHTIMRAGSLEAVFSYLASSSISTILAHHESANISAYGAYLATRIKAYANLKRDVIRDKSDRRAANRLRKLSVEQGLLRETREIQRMIAALVETKFFNDDVDDDVSMSALRLLVKDCLVLFQAVNEAVINILGSSPPLPLSILPQPDTLPLQRTISRLPSRTRKLRSRSTRPSVGIRSASSASSARQRSCITSSTFPFPTSSMCVLLCWPLFRRD